MVRIYFKTASGAVIEAEAKAGGSVLDAAHAAGVDMEGACEGCMSCSTCHVILTDADYDKLPPPSEEEEDLLDLAAGAVPTSRLACQIQVGDALEGMVFDLPKRTRNLLL